MGGRVGDGPAAYRANVGAQMNAKVWTMQANERALIPGQEFHANRLWVDAMCAYAAHVVAQNAGRSIDSGHGGFDLDTFSWLRVRCCPGTDQFKCNWDGNFTDIVAGKNHEGGTLERELERLPITVTGGAPHGADPQEAAGCAADSDPGTSDVMASLSDDGAAAMDGVWADGFGGEKWLAALVGAVQGVGVAGDSGGGGGWPERSRQIPRGGYYSPLRDVAVDPGEKYPEFFVHEFHERRGVRGGGVGVDADGVGGESRSCAADRVGANATALRRSVAECCGAGGRGGLLGAGCMRHFLFLGDSVLRQVTSGFVQQVCSPLQNSDFSILDDSFSGLNWYALFFGMRRGFERSVAQFWGDVRVRAWPVPFGAQGPSGHNPFDLAYKFECRAKDQHRHITAADADGDGRGTVQFVHTPVLFFEPMTPAAPLGSAAALVESEAVPGFPRHAGAPYSLPNAPTHGAWDVDVVFTSHCLHPLANFRQFEVYLAHIRIFVDRFNRYFNEPRVTARRRVLGLRRRAPLVVHSLCSHTFLRFPGVFVLRTMDVLVSAELTALAHPYLVVDLSLIHISEPTRPY